MIDTAPEVPHKDKYQISIQRGKTGQKVVILVPGGVDPEEVLNKYLNPAEGDKVLTIVMPLGRD
jgi:hypothetical protein